jgi:hypothetical protein
MTAARPRHAESINRGRRQTAVFDLFGGENRQGRAEAVAGEKDRPRARLNQRREFRFDQRPRRVERRLKTFMRVIGSQPAIRIGHQIAIERGVGAGERGHDAVFALADNRAGAMCCACTRTGSIGLKSQNGPISAIVCGASVS